jgi:hypothetical protein
MTGSVNGSIKLLSSESCQTGTRPCKNRVRQSFEWVRRALLSVVSHMGFVLVLLSALGFIWLFCLSFADVGIDSFFEPAWARCG